MERIEDLVSGENQQEHEGKWIPARPLPFYGLIPQFKDAWAVFTCKALAVQWPEQRARLKRLDGGGGD